MCKNDINFMALGGGQRVGASAYYLGLGDNHLLLDCGTGLQGGVRFNPVLQSLLEVPHLHSLSQLSEVFISHAHVDHCGYLPELLRQVPRCRAYMTQLTNRLLLAQLRDPAYARVMHYKQTQLREAEELLDRQAAMVSYLQEIPFKEYSVKFYQAGHIPGAMMVLLRYQGRNILYTGDFSQQGTSFTAACQLPQMEIDTMIMCGLHAKHSRHHSQPEPFTRIRQEVEQGLQSGKPVYCSVPQLSKGVELLTYLNQWLGNGCRIFLEDRPYQVISQLESLHLPILHSNNYHLSRDYCPQPGEIVVGTQQRGRRLEQFRLVNADFTLHDSFDETLAFIKRFNPRQAVVVHSPGREDEELETVEQRLMADPDCRTQFLFPEEKCLYRL